MLVQRVKILISALVVLFFLSPASTPAQSSFWAPFKLLLDDMFTCYILSSCSLCNSDFLTIFFFFHLKERLVDFRLTLASYCKQAKSLKVPDLILYPPLSTLRLCPAVCVCHNRLAARVHVSMRPHRVPWSRWQRGQSPLTVCSHAGRDPSCSKQGVEITGLPRAPASGKRWAVHMHWCACEVRCALVSRINRCTREPVQMRPAHLNRISTQNIVNGALNVCMNLPLSCIKTAFTQSFPS